MAVTLKDLPSLSTVHAGDCWVWNGKLDKDGYAVDGSYSRRVSRIVWTLVNGAIPSKLEVCHKCDTPQCVNPNHLFLATHQQNMDDRRRKGRASGGSHKGEANPTAKLDPDKVFLILKMLGQGRSQKSVGEEFGVAQATIHGISSGRLWSHITGRGT